MQVFRGFNHPGLPSGRPSPQNGGERVGCALTVGNFDGVHRGHQAMLALLRSEAQHRGLPTCVLTFEPHPRDYFARAARRPELAPTRIATLRDKLSELQSCGVDQVIVLRFDGRFASQSPQAFIDDVLVQGLGARYVLVGDDFRFGSKRAGDYAMLDAAGATYGFDVARMNSYEVHGLRVSSSAVREALAAGLMERAAGLLGRHYSVSGRVVHGRKLGRLLGASARGDDGFRTLNLNFGHARPAAMGIYAVRTQGLGLPGDAPVDGVASLGVRPTIDDAGRVLLEVHCLQWPAHLDIEGGYGKLVHVELLHKLRDEARYDSLDELTVAIRNDTANARRWLEEHSADAQRSQPMPLMASKSDLRLAR